MWIRRMRGNFLRRCHDGPRLGGGGWAQRLCSVSVGAEEGVESLLAKLLDVGFAGYSLSR
ncbi:hypothetical protein PXNS11_290378 [Stutzerimonas xanthomarina]|nr:hypothetical protein PXNS11_290378 [Stutzerimonas xanthomarina]